MTTLNLLRIVKNTSHDSADITEQYVKDAMDVRDNTKPVRDLVTAVTTNSELALAYAYYVQRFVERLEIHYAVERTDLQERIRQKTNVLRKFSFEGYKARQSIHVAMEIIELHEEAEWYSNKVIFLQNQLNALERGRLDPHNRHDMGIGTMENISEEDEDPADEDEDGI